MILCSSRRWPNTSTWPTSWPTKRWFTSRCSGRRPYFETLICRRGREPVGFALYFFTYSTFLGRPSLYLEDLFVRPEERGRGGGKALLSALAKIAVARGCGRMEWAVLDWNRPAIRLYKRLGAGLRKEWSTFRLTGDALALAGSR